LSITKEEFDRIKRLETELDNAIITMKKLDNYTVTETIKLNEKKCVVAELTRKVRKGEEINRRLQNILEEHSRRAFSKSKNCRL